MACADPDVQGRTDDYPDKFTFFWRKDSPFSQWHAAKFQKDGVLYNCAEQYMMHQKALLMGDKETAEEVLATDHPKDQKSLGRKVKNFDADLWDSKCYDIVKQGNMLKFGQNKKLKQILCDTAGTTLVEASPVDCIWGIGLAADNPAAKDRSQWKGQNLLGFALTDVREELMASDPKSDKYVTKYTFFWKSESPFSQWHQAEFTIDGVNFNCAEQYMMYQKAMLMGDEEIADKVIAEKSPKKQKALGRKVKNFDAGLWDSKCYDVVKKANHYKFSQNRVLKEQLLDTAGTTLVEASPVDTIWGIGLEASNPLALNRDTWRGKNLLGFALTDVRENLMLSITGSPQFDTNDTDKYPAKYTFFWKKDSPFSQWHPAKFTVDGTDFNCAEQFMMYNKAIIMEDEETAKKILKETNPSKHKALGKTVKNLDTDHERWNSKCVEVVKLGNYHKFTQNTDLQQILVDTAGTTLAEASPHDRKWGIGLEASDPQALDRNTWTGKNLLGFALTDVREQILGK